MKLRLLKKNGVLSPVPESTEEELQYFQRLKDNAYIECEIKNKRNPLFHRKYFALLKIGYDYIDVSGLSYKGEPVAKNFEAFREDIAKLCGFCEVVYSVLNANHYTLKAKSISFASMEQAEFELLYSQTINVLLAKVLPKSYDDSKLRQTVDRILGQFT